MKFLTNFDTKLDEMELIHALKKYGTKGHAILTKRHPIYLFLSLLWIIGSFLAFFCMIAFSYFQYFQTHPKAFGTVCVAQFLITLAWIIHSLIVIVHSMKTHAGKIYIDEVPEDWLKPWVFEHYLGHSFFSLVFQALLMIADIVLAIVLRANTFIQWIALIGAVTLNIMFLTIIYVTINKIIKYEMDFNIFTPESFSIYRQYGLFNSDTTSISTSTIKMIKENKVGWSGSLFGYGNLTIHPEWWSNQFKPITITYVTRPKILLKKLNELIDASKMMYNNNGNL